MASVLINHDWKAFGKGCRSGIRTKALLIKLVALQ